MPRSRDDAKPWLRQAADDYRFGRAALAGRFHAQACFVAQQSAEKAVKAVHYHVGARPVIGHSVHALLAKLNARAGVTKSLLVVGAGLDQFYVRTSAPAPRPRAAGGSRPPDLYPRGVRRPAALEPLHPPRPARRPAHRLRAER
jgi:HEPN domain-containing protein